MAKIEAKNVEARLTEINANYSEGLKASEAKEFIERLKHKYRFLCAQKPEFDKWDYYDAIEVTSDVISFLREYE